MRRSKKMPKKIVLAEDESHIARLITFKLEKEGYELTWAKDGGEALEKITEIMPDLVILDVMMPVMDGFEVLKKVKHDETLKAIPVIMLTAKGQDNDIVHGLDTGAADYIVKPFRPAELVARIRRIIG